MAKPYPLELQRLLELFVKIGVKVEVIETEEGYAVVGVGSKAEPEQPEQPAKTESAAFATPYDTATTGLSAFATPHDIAQLHRRIDEALAGLSIRPTNQQMISHIVKAGNALAEDIERGLTDAGKRITELERRADTNKVLLGNRDQNVTEAFDEQQEKIDEAFTRIELLKKGLDDLNTEFRKQAGLLHRRVTKRKHEIAGKANSRKKKS